MVVTGVAIVEYVGIEVVVGTVVVVENVDVGIEGGTVVCHLEVFE